MSFAAEEVWNDSELVKGVGRVPLNQQILAPEEPIEDKPFELSPRAYASNNFRYPLQYMITSDLNTDNHKIFPCKSRAILLLG
jgi:hypothetical protein